MKMRYSQIWFLFLLILNVGLAMYWLNQKEGWFVDEQWSYAHANSTQGAYLSDDIDSYFQSRETDLHHRGLDGKIFHNYLTVQESDRFHYQHISDNLKVVEHPPLYFWILHTICSFTPDVINPWQAGSINLIAFLLSLIVLYKLSKLFIKDNYFAMAPVFLWGFSDIGLAGCVFLRMYMMQTLFALCLIYEVCLLLKENKADKKRLFLIFLYSALGILTQYNSIMLSFITAVVTCVILFWRNNWKLLFYFSLMMLLSVAVLFVLFPQAFEVLLFSHRGQEVSQKYQGGAISSIWNGLVYAQNHTRLFGIYFEKLFGISNVYDIYLLLIAIVVGEVLYRKKIFVNPLFLPLFIILMIMTSFLEFLMPWGQDITSRYFMLLMPLASLLIMYLLIFVLQNVKVPFYVMMLYLCSLVIWHTASTDFSDNVYRTLISEETRNYKKELENKSILIVSEISAFFDNAIVFAHAKEVYWELMKKVDNVDVFPSISDDVISKVDYVLIQNGWVWQKKCFICRPIPRSLSAELLDKMQYIGGFRNSDLDFDLYKVIKNDKAL